MSFFSFLGSVKLGSSSVSTEDFTALIKRLSLAFGLFVFSRIGFYFYNLSYFQDAGLAETVMAFFVGLRFDLATTLIANLFFIIGSIFPWRSGWYRQLLKVVFVACNTVYLGFIIGDYEFFAFNGKKLTYEFFLMAGDIQDQSFQLALNYWYLSLMIVAVGWSLWRFYPQDSLVKPPMRIYKAISLSLLIFVLTGIGVRGGLQLRSISPKEAFIFKTHELGNFALNSAYSLVRSFGEEGAPPADYFSNDQEAFKTMLEKRDYGPSEWGVEKQNIVIIIVESLAQEYVDEGFAPFVSELASKGLYFDRNFANGRRSMEALPSIMTSFPSIIGAPVYQTPYQANKFHALPKILKDQGYVTAFFHGGKRGTMDFDAYCYSIGFEEYHALEDYPDQSHFDGHWGVYDHLYLDYVADKLGEFKEPFFTGIFTLSSHQPYSIPKKLQGRFPKGSLPIHESIGYADYSLKKFFEKASSKKWFRNTLFIITADHTQKLSTKKFQSLLGRYRVPLIFYHPEVELMRSGSKELTQHVDILPSVLDFLNISYPKRLYYGASVFNEDRGRMVNLSSAGHFLLKERSLVSFDGAKPKFFKVGEELLKVTPSQPPFPRSQTEMVEELKAIIQYTNNGLRNNNIYHLAP